MTADAAKPSVPAAPASPAPEHPAQDPLLAGLESMLANGLPMPAPPKNRAQRRAEAKRKRR